MKIDKGSVDKKQAQTGAIHFNFKSGQKSVKNLTKCRAKNSKNKLWNFLKKFKSKKIEENSRFSWPWPTKDLSQFIMNFGGINLNEKNEKVTWIWETCIESSLSLLLSRKSTEFEKNLSSLKQNVNEEGRA